MGAARLGDMDGGRHRQGHIALTAPGTHVFAARRLEARRDGTTNLSRPAAAIRTFIGMTAIAPQDPAWWQGNRTRPHAGIQAVTTTATWAVSTPMPKILAIFEPPSPWAHPFTCIRKAVKGSSVRCSSRAGRARCYGFWGTRAALLRLIVMGVFDRFPKLKFIVGHGGESFALLGYRLDSMHAAGIRSGRYEFLKPLTCPSPVLQAHIYVPSRASHGAASNLQSTLRRGSHPLCHDYPYNTSRRSGRSVTR